MMTDCDHCRGAMPNGWVSCAKSATGAAVPKGCTETCRMLTRAGVRVNVTVRATLPAAGQPPAKSAGWHAAEARRRASLSAIWAEMHGMRLDDLTAVRAWHDALPSKLGVSTCDCRTHWAAYVTANPVDLSGLDAYRRWTWAAHNAVSRRLINAEATWEEACERWGW